LFNKKTKKYALSVQFGTKWLKCATDNQKVKFTGAKEGFIKCPGHIQRFCQRYFNHCKNDCMGRGRCMKNNQCQCYDGFTGEDCGDRVNLKEALTNGSFQVTETIITDKCLPKKLKLDFTNRRELISLNRKDDVCQNGGLFVTSIGYCMCNVGFTGSACQDVDELTKMYYKIPAFSQSGGGNYN